MRFAWCLIGAVLAAGCSDGGDASCPRDLPATCPADAAGYQATIAPLLAAKCLTCHSPGGPGGNFVLETYDQVFALRSEVLDQVYACRMPQAGSPTLTLAEREALLGWLVCGAPDN